MKRSRSASPSGLTKEADELIWLAKGSGESASRSEDAYWDALLAAQIDTLLHAGEEDLLGAVLDYLHEQFPLGYEALADMLESRAESGAEDGADDGVRTGMARRGHGGAQDGAGGGVHGRMLAQVVARVKEKAAIARGNGGSCARPDRSGGAADHLVFM